ncbi:MAG: thrombospondin type 3 repeat-containing protein [Nanoarchaeota archaeon]
MRTTLAWRVLLAFLLLAILNSFTFAQHQQNQDYDNDSLLNQQDNCPYTPNAGVRGELMEGQSNQFAVEGTTYAITLDFVDADEAKFTINNEATSKLKVGEAYFLSDHSKIIVQEIFYQDYGNGLHGASFLIGAQKDSDKNGVGDACPYYGSEAERLEELQEQFNDLEKEYYQLRDSDAGEKDTGEKDAVKDTAKKLPVERLVETVKEFNVNVQELQDDIEENDDLENRRTLRDAWDELEEDGQHLQAKVTDLLAKFSQQVQQYLPSLAYQPLSALELPALSAGEQGQLTPTQKVIVQKLNFPVAAAPAGNELAPNQPAILWLVVAIAVVLIMILFLLLAAVPFR